MTSTTTTTTAAATTLAIALQVTSSSSINNMTHQEKLPPTGAAAMATGGYPAPTMPVFEDLYKKRQWQLEHMAGAFRVFARKGYTEGGAGHISVRDPVDPSTFWINP